MEKQFDLSWMSEICFGMILVQEGYFRGGEHPLKGVIKVPRPVFCFFVFLIVSPFVRRYVYALYK